MTQSGNKKQFNWDRQFVNFSFTALLLIAATMISIAVHQKDHSGSTASIMIYMMAVLIISRITDGYMWGIVSSFVSVIAVNFIFTYPYWELNFTITGYPLTFLTMFLVSVLTSAASTRIKLGEHVRIESEREQVRANLLRAISHDIRTPLTSIIGASSALLDEDVQLTDEQRLQLIKDINDDGQWLISVTENILSITRIDGDNEIIKQPELGEELIEAALRKFNKRHSASIQVDVNLPDETRLIPMDIMLVEQVLLNLMENAVIHGTGLKLITIGLEYTEDTAVFTVFNDGTCIPDYKLPTLFDGQIKSDKTINNSGKRSMGIGLAVCRTIINAHKGTISARNLEDRSGVEFTFTLPLDKENTYED